MGKSASTDKTTGSSSKKPATTKKAVTKTAKAPATTAKKAAKAPAKKKPTAVASPAPPSHEDISLRAYFISEKRMQLGLPGDSAQDWVEAESQLVAELLVKKPAKKAKA